MEFAPEEVKEVEKEIGISKRKKKKRLGASDIEEFDTLSSMSGSEVIKVLDFLHRRYLSWMTEAESAKYSGLYKTAREEALKEVMETYSEIQKQNQALLEKLESLIKILSEKQITPESVAQQTAQEIRKSLLEDPRIRGLIFVILETLFSNNPNYQKLRGILTPILFPEMITVTSEEQKQ